MNFKAYYNVKEDRIYNAEPFSYSWFHEKRHQTQFKTIRGLDNFEHWFHIITYGLSSGWLLTSLFALVPFKWAIILMGLSVVPYSLFNLLLELDAIIFGTIDYLKHKKRKY